MSDTDEKFSLVNLPPAGHKDAGSFFWDLFELARAERDRLMLPERWLENYKLYRGDHWQEKGITKNKNKLTVNLFFANVERTKANITAKNPIAEIIDMDGYNDEIADTLTAWNKQWWKDTKQQRKLNSTVLNMENYGITIEKAYYDFKKDRGDIAIVDSYAFFPAPGNWEDIGSDCPYICHAYPEPIEAIEAMFDVSGVEADDVYSLLGEEREEKRPLPSGHNETVSYAGTYNAVVQQAKKGAGTIQGRGLVVEIWVRDESIETIEEPVVSEDGITETDKDGAVIMSQIKRPKYPGGIRVVTLTKSGSKIEKGEVKQPIVLDDKKNPNINHNLPVEKTSKTYLYDRFPFYKANSYEDTTSLWGFSAAEQVGDLNYKIDELFSRLLAYAKKAMHPILTVPTDTGITREQLNNKPGLVLWPSTGASGLGIRFVPIPNLSADFFKILDIVVSFFDRVYQIEDADRGVAPKGVVAASAIVALQERNATLLHHKIEAVDYLAEERGRCNISFLQNFSSKMTSIDVNDEPRKFIGTNLAGRKFNYVVEAGSMMPKTSLQVAAQSEKNYELGAIDRQALLENTGYPGWKQIIERVGEGQLGQALQILIQAGLPEEEAMMLQQFLMQPQGGPGNTTQSGQKTVTPGTPKASQGAMPPANVVAGEEGGV